MIAIDMIKLALSDENQVNTLNYYEYMINIK